VVIPVGRWRSISEPPPRGLYLVSDSGSVGQTRMFFDRASLPDETGEARDRERVRELVRLLYVTLTRGRLHLVIPWNRDFGVRRKNAPSFAELWGLPELFDALPEVQVVPTAPHEDVELVADIARSEASVGACDERRPLASLPRRLLPHQLAKKADLTRGLRHETTLDQAAPSRLSAGDEAIDYGVWWHETMEFTPWHSDEGAIERYWEGCMVEARSRGFGGRAGEELSRLRTSVAWKELRSDRWTLAAELSVLAPLGAGEWIDGVMDLVFHDAVFKQVWVLDWKTNRQRQGESGDDLLKRLGGEYAPQLQAYGLSLHRAMPGYEIKLLVFASFAGEWLEVEQPS